MPAVMAHRFHVVDVFAEERYAGNPLAVVAGAGDLDAPTMQRIALEFGFSETTFVVSDPQGDERRTAVRIFTPTRVTLGLGVGPVPVDFAPEGGREVAWLTAPPVTLGRTLPPERIAPALGLAAGDLAAELPAQHVSAGVEFLHVPLASREALERMRLAPAAYAPLEAEGFPSHVYAFARTAEGPADLRARMQLYERDDPTRSVREDPATGSATACLGAYLLAHDSGEVTLRIAQGVEMGRPSLLRLEARGGADAPVIRVGGCVVEVARGELL
jgi:trans-2,3-dihydro-3-hydroxyanthranilate isomerase